MLPLWSPDSSKIAFLQDNDGDESFNLFTVSLCDGEVHQITEFKGCNFRGYSWSPNGDYLAFAANIDGCYSIFIIQSDGRGLRRLTSATRHDILPQWSPKGDYIVYTKHESGNKFSSVQIINMNGIREASKCSAKSSLTAKTWDSNGIRIVSHCMKPGSKNLGLFQPDTGRVLWIQEEECELGRVWSKDGNYSACVIDNKRNSQMVILDNSNGTKKMIGPGRGLSEEPEFSYDNRFVVFLHEGPQNPSDLYLYDIVKDELKQLTEGLPDHVDASELVIPEEIMYRSYDGLQIPALVYKPQVSKGSGLPPAVLRIHGGPNYRSYINWDPTIQLLVSHGYIVFAPNYRGSTGYGNEFMELNRNDWGGGDLKDVIAAASYLEKEELADASLIGLYGGSYGAISP